MPLSLDTLDLSVVEGGGGSRIVLGGTFPVGPLRVHVGPTGTAADEKALSGVPGSPDPESRTGTTLIAYLPVLAPGTYNIFVTNGVLSDSLPNSITIVRANHRSGVFTLRSAYSPLFAVGPRSVDRVP